MLAVVVFIAEIALVVFQLRAMHRDHESMEELARGSIWRTTAYAALALPLLLATVVMAVICTRSFNRGLKPILQEGRLMAKRAVPERSRDLEGCTTSGEDFHRTSSLIRRMELD